VFLEKNALIDRLRIEARMEMMVGRCSLVAMLLVILISVPFVVSVVAQEQDERHATERLQKETETETPEEDVELPIGVELAARFHELLETHKAQIMEIIEEFKFNNSQNHEERLRIIEAYHNQTRIRLEEMKTQRTRLYELFNNGTIDRDEFIARMRLLKASLKGCERLADKLGWQLSEVAEKAAEQYRRKAQVLKDLNRQMLDEMKAALQEIKEKVKSHGPPRMTWTTNGTVTKINAASASDKWDWTWNEGRK